MVADALLIAAGGAIYPIALAFIVAILGGQEPIRRGLVFWAGGAVASFLGYVLIVELARSRGVTPGQHSTLAASIRIALGGVLVLIGGRLYLRRRRGTSTGSTARAGTGGRPGPQRAASLRKAFVSGVVVYFPGIFLIASAMTMAGASTKAGATIVLSVVAVILLLLIVEVPILAVAVSPPVQPRLKRCVDVVEARSKTLGPPLMLAAGAYLIITGAGRL